MSLPPSASFTSAFPDALAEQVCVVGGLLEPTRLASAGSSLVWVDGETVRVPYRIYHQLPDPSAIGQLTPTQQLICACLLTRHHNGFVRQAHLEQVVTATQSWTVPFVVQLVGEYVIEILSAIRQELDQLDIPGTAQQIMYGRFVADNPAFVRLVRQRVASYWNCYYRQLYGRLVDYPGHIIVEALDAAARHHAAVTMH